MIKYKVDLEEISYLLKKKLPKAIVEKIYIWALKIEMTGMTEVRKSIGLHDEPLKGQRLGQRSIRLSKGYRLFYLEIKSESIIVVKAIEVNKHEY